MLKVFKKLFFLLIRASGIPYIARFLFQSKRITIIYYHDIEPKAFYKQVKYISNNYTIIGLETLSSYLNGELLFLPKFPLLITFDDGHLRNYELLDIFKKFKVRPVIFLTTENINSNKPYWFKLPFKSQDEKNRLKKCPDEERRDYIKVLYNELPKDIMTQSLNWIQIKELSVFVNFQSHTHSHPCLPNCRNEVVLVELKTSKCIIEKELNKSVYAIAYPNGDFSKRVIEISKELGYTLGFSGKAGLVFKNTDPFILPRISINDTNDFNEFIVRLSGVWAFVKRFF